MVCSGLLGAEAHAVWVPLGREEDRVRVQRLVVPLCRLLDQLVTSYNWSESLFCSLMCKMIVCLALKVSKLVSRCLY